ncbi:P53 induced protein [Nesidiocoris tenuis]|uniref:P53 induced protein n=1 Tax=Nesidiocoris tenuis TaxID=355587 RepID=A0ABN7APD7_9HEMI|nr:P53 induced protein [Nesidiocoris tenuis]
MSPPRMDNVYTVVGAVVKGFVDSLRGALIIFTLDESINEQKRSPARHDIASLRRVSENPLVKSDRQQPKKEKKILKRTLQCCGLNGGIFWLSILLFEWGLLPLVNYLILTILGQKTNIGQTVSSIVESSLSFVFSTMWVLPLLLLSKVVNSLWFQDIADSVYRHSRGRPTVLSSVGKLIADAMFSVLVQFFFLIQTMLISYFPVAPLGYIFYLVHTCLLFSLYSFEYKMYNMGWELHKRLNFIEANWPYFIGFGLPLSVLTSLTSSYIISGCIFSILFPFFIISANEAEPLVNLSSSHLRLFSPVIALSNALFHQTVRPLVEPKGKRTR